MNKEIFRNKWIEITRGFNFAYEVSQYHERYTLVVTLIYFTFYIGLPNFGYDFNKWDRGWGLYWFESAILWKWGQKTWCWRMPWDWEHVRHEVMFSDGLKKPVGDSWDLNDGRIVDVYPYTYKLKNGIIQNREATVYIEEREWRWRWFRWLRWPRLIRRSISVDFNDEVGERTGSWKGGTIGCGYDLLPGESAYKCLRRMEKQRVFD